jgi:GntR family transcriptional regulator
MSNNPPYQVIAERLRTEIVAGTWDRPDVPFPGARSIGERFGVSIHTASRAIQYLASEGFLNVKAGQRPLVTHPDERAMTWPLTGRYARARAAEGLVFAADISGELRKVTTGHEWVTPPPVIAKLLGVERDAQVYARRSQTQLEGRVIEVTTMYFPAPIITAVPALAADGDVRVVRLIEATGRKITRTTNRIVARLATAHEAQTLQLNGGAVVFEHTHGTYTSTDEPVEAVLNIKSAEGAVLTFDTYEGD